MPDVPFGFLVGKKWYAFCANCGGVVRVNKPLIGSLHVCKPAEKKDAE